MPIMIPKLCSGHADPLPFPLFQCHYLAVVNCIMRITLEIEKKNRIFWHQISFSSLFEPLKCISMGIEISTMKIMSTKTSNVRVDAPLI